MIISLLLIILQQISEFSTSAQGRTYNPPDGILFYIVLIVSWLIVAAVVAWAIKCLFWPGEDSHEHIKYKILEDEKN